MAPRADAAAASAVCVCAWSACVRIRAEAESARWVGSRYSRWVAAIVSGARVADSPGEISAISGDVVVFYKDERRAQWVP